VVGYEKTDIATYYFWLSLLLFIFLTVVSCPIICEKKVISWAWSY